MTRVAFLAVNGVRLYEHSLCPSTALTQQGDFVSVANPLGSQFELTTTLQILKMFNLINGEII